MANTEKRVAGPWVARVLRLGEEPTQDDMLALTPEQSIALVWELSRRTSELAGMPMPTYDRADMPVRVTRPA